jgi:nitric oxide reductase NorQ protein
MEFDYPAPDLEALIVASEGGVDLDLAKKLVKLGELTRNLKGQGLDEGASTRLLVHAAQIVSAGRTPNEAANAAIARALTDDPDMTETLDDLVRAVF